ncbi:hypothetical protein AB0I37_02885 [Micromonospora purpureochromogenes]|uniref:hypothetical protein n=1 Tax=Micromonospora purpureochromogenes TaxID=47872 RepID=UPI00340B392E
MSLLWDHTIEHRADELSRFSRGELCELSLRGVEGTTPFFDPPFLQYFPPAYSSMIEAALAACRSVAPDWRLGADVSDEFHGNWESLPKMPLRPGVGPYMMAVSRLVDGMSGVMDSEVALEILSACYESVMLSHLAGRITLEMQKENESCRAVVRLQEELIEQYRAG